MPIKTYQVALPLLKATRVGSGVELSGFLGSATIIDSLVCTCKHVIEGHVDFSRELVVSTWDLSQRYTVFTGAMLHPSYDFAILVGKEPPPFSQLPLMSNEMWAGTPVLAAGFNDDGSQPGRYSVSPRIFSGNVVRVFDEANIGRSARVAELSFPVLSGFSGGPLISTKFDRVCGMAYGNLEQAIQVHAIEEFQEGGVKMSETVKRIVEYGLFHTATDLRLWIDELRGRV